MKIPLAYPRPVKLVLHDDSRAVALARSLGVPISTVLRECVAEGLAAVEKNGIRPKHAAAPSAAPQGGAR